MQAIERIRVAMYHESDDLEFACNPAAMTEVLAHIDALTAEVSASDIAIAEYRQQCLDNAAEIARLRAESEERLQNCAALVAENERIRKDAERYRWIKSAKGLTLESERGGPWTRENGGTFTPSHRLCAGGTQFAPCETLDDAIDTAMKGTP